MLCTSHWQMEKMMVLSDKQWMQTNSDYRLQVPEYLEISGQHPDSAIFRYQRSTTAISIVAPTLLQHKWGSSISRTPHHGRALSLYDRASQYWSSLGFMRRSRAPCFC